VTFNRHGNGCHSARRAPSGLELARLGPALQTLTYAGEPRAIADFDIDALVRQAQRAGAVIVMACGVGDTIVMNTPLLRVYGATVLSEKALMRAVRLARARTFAPSSHHAVSNFLREPRTTPHSSKRWAGLGTPRTAWSTRLLKTKGWSLTDPSTP
jgi:hypothetical protein